MGVRRRESASETHSSSKPKRWVRDGRNGKKDRQVTQGDREIVAVVKATGDFGLDQQSGSQESSGDGKMGQRNTEEAKIHRTHKIQVWAGVRRVN